MMRFLIKIVHKEWFTDEMFEVGFVRPEGLEFQPGQHIRFHHNDLERDYTLISIAEDDPIRICVRQVRQPGFSTILSDCDMGDVFEISGPYGYFLYHPSGPPAVFIGTATGVAPFVSFARSGVSEYTLLQGARNPDALIYQDLLRQNSRTYVPCLSRWPRDPPANAFHGRVTEYLETILLKDIYSFYLCGRRQMILDTMVIIDERFPDSRVFTERFT